MVGVVGVPHRLGGFALVLWRFYPYREQHRAEHAGTPPRPPLGHLVNGLACVALDGRDLVDGDDGEINFKTGLGPIGIGEIHRLDRNFTPRADGGSNLFSQQFLFIFSFGAWRHGCLRL